MTNNADVFDWEGTSTASKVEFLAWLGFRKGEGETHQLLV